MWLLEYISRSALLGLNRGGAVFYTVKQFSTLPPSRGFQWLWCQHCIVYHLHFHHSGGCVVELHCIKLEMDSDSIAYGLTLVITVLTITVL